MGSDVLVTLWDGPTWASPKEFPNKIGAPHHMHSVLTRQARKTALVATFACLGGFAAAAASPAHADPLSTATYRLEAADGATIAQADCLTDQQAAETSFCQSLIARNDGTKPAKTGSETLQWLRDARAAGAAKVITTEAGDGFTGRTTYTVPADDDSAYRETSVGTYPPSAQTRTSRYEVTSINALAAELDCMTGRDPSRVQAGPYGAYCRVDSVRPLPAADTASAKRRHGNTRRRHRAHPAAAHRR
jgi:hypothetical protein